MTYSTKGFFNHLKNGLNSPVQPFVYFLASIIGTVLYGYMYLGWVASMSLSHWLAGGMALIPMLVGIYATDYFFQSYALNYYEDNKTSDGGKWEVKDLKV